MYDPNEERAYEAGLTPEEFEQLLEDADAILKERPLLEEGQEPS